MFTTKIWDKKGVTLGFGPPGVEKSYVADMVIQEAKAKGLSAKKMFHRLDRHANWASVQVVRIHIFLCTVQAKIKFV